MRIVLRASSRRPLAVAYRSRWPAIGCMVASVALGDAIVRMSAGEASAQVATQAPAKPVSAPQTPTPEQWRRHPSYQVFDKQAVLPAMEVAAKGTLRIGNELNLELARASQLPTDQKKALAAQLELPMPVLDKFLQRLEARQGVDAAQSANDFHTLIIDYRYLRDRWNQYKPPAGQEKTKTEALQSLEAGDLDKAWQMFVALTSPAPPSQLQATKAP